MEESNFINALISRLCENGVSRVNAERAVSKFAADVPAERVSQLNAACRDPEWTRTFAQSLMETYGLKPEPARVPDEADSIDDIDDIDEIDEMLEELHSPDTSRRDTPRPAVQQQTGVPHTVNENAPHRRPMRPNAQPGTGVPSQAAVHSQRPAPQNVSQAAKGAGAPNQQQVHTPRPVPQNMPQTAQGAGVQNQPVRSQRPAPQNMPQPAKGAGIQNQPVRGQRPMPQNSFGADSHAAPRPMPKKQLRFSDRILDLFGCGDGSKHPIRKPDPNADYSHFYTVFGCTSPLWVLALLVLLALFVFAFATLIAGIAFLIAALFVGVAVGTALALVGIVYGITQLFGYVPIGMYEIGLGIKIGGITMLLGILAYNAAIRLIPYLIKKLAVLFMFTARKCIELYYRLKGAYAGT